MSDGEVSPSDAEEIREFGNFLADAGPPPGAPGHDPLSYRQALRDHHELVMGPLPHPDFCFVCHEKKLEKEWCPFHDDRASKCGGIHLDQDPRMNQPCPGADPNNSDHLWPWDLAPGTTTHCTVCGVARRVN